MVGDNIYSYRPSASCSDDVDPFACLVTVDAQILADANAAVAAAALYGTYVFVPVVDGTAIKERLTVALARGILNGVRPCVPGFFVLELTIKHCHQRQDVLFSVTNTFEGAIFVSSSVTNITNYFKELFPLLTSDQAVAAAKFYRGLNETLPSAVEQARAIYGECALSL